MISRTSLFSVLLATLAVAALAGVIYWWQPKTVAEAPAQLVITHADARAMILAPAEGSGPIDAQIRVTQDQLRKQPEATRSLEQLGRLFIAKARTTFDPGYYKLAEQCARVLAEKNPDHPPALLLQGHVMLAMHRFREAEEVARRLVKLNGQVLEYALLGDALLDQGKLDEAVSAYQSMIDAKPCLPSYSRVAHIRWLMGDLEGAIEVIRQAISTGSYRDPEPLAWVTARLAHYQLQSGDLAAALATAERAVGLVPDYPPALLVRARVHLAQDDPAAAVKALEPATAKNPLPEYQWALADALRAADRGAEAAAVEKQLVETGAGRDPRTFSLYLATRREQPEEALALAKSEMEERRDAFTYDALAWAQWAAGDLTAARGSMASALAPGTPDARLYLHAAIIAQAAGETSDARDFLEKARALRRMLLPSEQSELERGRSALESTASRSSQPQMATQTKP